MPAPIKPRQKPIRAKTREEHLALSQEGQTVAVAVPTVFPPGRLPAGIQKRLDANAD